MGIAALLRVRKHKKCGAWLQGWHDFAEDSVGPPQFITTLATQQGEEQKKSSPAMQGCFSYGMLCDSQTCQFCSTQVVRKRLRR